MLQFALVLDGKTFPACLSLHIQRVEGRTAATWHGRRVQLNDVDFWFYRVAGAAAHTCDCAHLAVPKVVCWIPLRDPFVIDDWLPLYRCSMSQSNMVAPWLYASARMTVRDKQWLEQ